ncbi:hypothetical protein OC834_007261 [Tilletia horrida]|uniref:Uncharacterized protein n=1 Tax=Tilletia horrida TaxID=155126 RepID=A0AAN6G445_9BASI|nr:hypothetical protein OC842_007454 [Tilletia horrida]KAK0519804.1 hypothetical protein OC834_007261 [Tilletia horrida]
MASRSLRGFNRLTGIEDHNFAAYDSLFAKIDTDPGHAVVIKQKPRVAKAMSRETWSYSWTVRGHGCDLPVPRTSSKDGAVFYELGDIVFFRPGQRQGRPALFIQDESGQKSGRLAVELFAPTAECMNRIISWKYGDKIEAMLLNTHTRYVAQLRNLRKLAQNPQQRSISMPNVGENYKLKVLKQQ